MSNKGKLIRNSARCRNCKEHLISTHRHDFRKCKCMMESDEILQKLYKRDSLALDYDDPKVKQAYAKCHGIFVDGGNAYSRRGYYKIGDLEETSIYDDKEEKD